MSKCEECKFWKKEREIKSESYGQCRRYAPKLIVSGGGIGENREYENDWAWTDFNAWCGEFQPKNDVFANGNI